jgi:SAM-dependent methyltransferase
MTLQDTRERALPAHAAQTLEDYLVYLKHAAMYAFAQAFVADKRVLDLGCGEGYGSAILVRAARFVVAADYDRDAVAHAARKYAGARLAFVVCDAQRLPFRRAVFGAIISYEVIEHIPNVSAYLNEIKRVGSFALISTPNAALRLLPFQKPWNRFHLREYAARAFARELRGAFGRVDVRGVSAIPRVLAIERARVRQNPLVAYPRMIAQMFLPRRVYVALKPARTPAALPFRAEDFSASDYRVTDETRECINLLAVCKP